MATILASIRDGVEATSDPISGENIRWQESMRIAVRSSHELLKLLQLPQNALDEGAVADAERDFPVFVPREFAARMRVCDPKDPLLLQVLASPEEVAQDRQIGSVLDPVGDQAAERNPGLLQKYFGRALLITSGACAVHCRYCFRRHFPYETAPKGKSGWQESLSVIRQDRTLDEVILSGGDPLTVADSQLQWLISQINQLEHIQRIRIHTRVPIVIPQRVCEELLSWVESSRAAIYFVLHINHPQEIDLNVELAVKRLRRSGATLLNQAVLLRGINDCPAIQFDLCRRLVNLQILPYYLHQLDRAQGSLHFETPFASGHEIIDHLRNNLPGYAVPKFVREEAGQPSKSPL